MCFSNLPIEFDEDGNPTLAEEADEVEHPPCGCDGTSDTAIEATDPRAAYDDIVDSLSGDVKRRLEGVERDGDRPPATDRREAEGD